MSKRRAKEDYKFDSNFLTPEDRPKKRADCANIPRPCPYVSCRHHLGLDVFSNDQLKINFKKNPKADEVDFDRMQSTCALDLAETGGMDLEQIGDALNLTRERVRQIVEESFQKIKDNIDEDVVRILFSFSEP